MSELIDEFEAVCRSAPESETLGLVMILLPQEVCWSLLSAGTPHLGKNAKLNSLPLTDAGA